MARRRPNICVEFDSVIHSYTSGWKGTKIVADDPMPGAIEWLVDIQPDAIVNILSPRYRSEGGKEAVQDWLFEQIAIYTDLSEIEARELVYEKIKYPADYPPANMYISARGYRFTGKFPTGNEIAGFKPETEDGADPVKLGMKDMLRDATLTAMAKLDEDDDDVTVDAADVLRELRKLVA